MMKSKSRSFWWTYPVLSGLLLAGCGADSSVDVAPSDSQENSSAALDVTVGILPVRHHVDLDAGWRFLRSDAPGAEATRFDDATWSTVTTPHTWNALDGQDGKNDYYRGIGWYRRHVAVPFRFFGK